MAVMRICKFGEEVLNKRTDPVTAWNEELERIVREMEETMHAARGIGLAANQVGLAKQLAIIDLAPGTQKSELWVLTNPEIVEATGAVKEEEGCLSIPGFTEMVERPEKVVVRFHDLAGDEKFIEASGLMARALCHELDHLDGTLFPQRIRGMRGDLVRKRVKKAAKSGEWEEVFP
jgi:peptide deformylase